MRLQGCTFGKSLFERDIATFW